MSPEAPAPLARLPVDPAADGLLQPMLFFKGFHALATYRVAHSLWTDGGGASQGAALLLQSRCAELPLHCMHQGSRRARDVEQSPAICPCPMAKARQGRNRPNMKKEPIPDDTTPPSA